MVKLTGASCGLLAFAIAIIRGLSVHNPPTTVLERAIFAMVLFFVLGSALGWVAQRVVTEHVRLKEEEALASQRQDEESVSEESPPNSENNSTRPGPKPIAT